MPGLFALQVRAIAEAACDQLKAGKDPQVEIMVPLVGSVMELHLVRDEADRHPGRGCAARRGVTLDDPDRHDDRAAAGRAHRAPDRRGRRLLLLRHQRPDPDHLGLLPRRRRGGVLRRPTWTRASSPSRRSRPSTPTASAGWCEIAAEEGRRSRARPQARRLRRARRRPGVHPLLPPRRPGLRLLLAVPGPGRPAGGRPRGRQTP